MSDGGNVLPRIAKAEHVGPEDTGDNIEAKRVVNYVWNGTSWERQSSSSSGLARATDAYSIQAISDDGTYRYFFFEDADANYYIMRKTTATSLFKYTKGTGGYSSVYVDATHGPSGTPSWADYGSTF